MLSVLRASSWQQPIQGYLSPWFFLTLVVFGFKVPLVVTIVPGRTSLECDPGTKMSSA